MTVLVDVFFYGSYMNFDVLARAGISRRPHRVGRLPGYRLHIGPLANLVAEPDSVCYGILTQLTHAELDRLYGSHIKQVLGGEYFPQAVLFQDIRQHVLPALTYIAIDMEHKPADAGYVSRILNPARDYGFPPWFLDHIQSFAP